MKDAHAKKKAIFKDAGFYTVLSYSGQFLDVVSSILIRRFLGPTNMGIWAFLQVILNYTKHSSLGITAATNRDVPYYQEKGDHAQADRIKNTVFSFTMTTTLAASFLIVGWAFLNRDGLNLKLWIGFIAIACIISIQRLYNLYVVLLRANKRFKIAGFVNFASSSLNLLFTLLLVWKFQLYGLYASVVLNSLLLIAYIIYKTKYRFEWVHPFKNTGPMLKLGVTLLISEVLTTFVMSADKILITKYLGFETLGFYSIAMMAFNYLSGIPRMFNVVLFPRFQEEYAQTDKAAALEKYLTKAVLSMAYIYPFLIGLVWICSPWLIELVLPQFYEGVSALKVLSLGSFFFALTHSFNTFLVTIRKEYMLIPAQLALTLIVFPVTFFAIKGGWGITGVAMAMSVTYGCKFLILSYFSMREIFDWKKMMTIYAKVLLAFGYLVGSILMTKQIFGHSFGQGALSFMHFAFFCLLSLPFLYFLEREVNLRAMRKK